MKTFLSLVAHDLFERKNGDLSRTVMVFPGRRAGLFFNRCLLDENAGRPLFAPACMALSDLFGTLSPLRPDNPIRLICALHHIYCEATGSDESIDEFYTWGQLLLSDFDDIDKNLVHSHDLFRNLSDYKELSSPHDYLTDEQLKIIHRFFEGFEGNKGDTALRQNFTKIWKVMGTIYDRLHEELAAQGLGYEGMISRDAVEHFDEYASRLEADTYVFVGFNVLSAVEEKLFTEMKKSGKALFYWDYDHYYYDAPDNEAGTFIRQDIKKFGNALDESSFDPADNPFDRLRHLRQIDVVSAPTDDAQAGYVHEWLTTYRPNPNTETAIVLCDESLIRPVLYALPSTISDINVTMGLPMSQTTVCTRLNALLTEDVPDDVTPSAWLHGISATIDSWGASLRDRDDRLQEEEEALYRAHIAIGSLIQLVDDGTLNAGRNLLMRLLHTILDTTSIPFHGEPAKGLQVMGVLETRNLDFSYLLLLSVNEGMLPKAPSEVSFIPFTLRKAFGLTTIERQTAVYAYYFYRMIQRAEKVTLVCNNGTNGLNAAMPSRFITQLQMESDIDIRSFSLAPSGNPAIVKDPITVARTPDVQRRLEEHFSIHNPDGTPKAKASILSPTALNDWMNCRLQFYLKHIEGLKADNDDTEEVSVSQFGTIFHRSAELAYKQLTEANPTVTGQQLRALANNELAIRKLVKQAFRDEYFKGMPEDYDGIHLINFSAICKYLSLLLTIDANYAGVSSFRFEQGEQFVGEDRVISSKDHPLTIRLGGIVDRIDSKDGVTRVVDYKTGGNETGVDTIENLFSEKAKNRRHYVFQAFYYSWLLSRRHPDRTYSPALLYTRRTAAKDYNPIVTLDKTPVTDFKTMAGEEFEQRLTTLIDDIFNSEAPFIQSPDEDACTHCDFCALCGRTPKSQIFR